MIDLKLNAKKTNEIDSYLGVYASLLKNREVWYISAPVTTGKRYLEWYQKEGSKFRRNSSVYKKAHLKNVVTPNNARINSLERRISISPDIRLINPTSVQVARWEQHDYYYFWSKIIEEYANTIVFLDGWEYSAGCSFEFYVAKKRRIRVIDEHYRAISSENGIAAIKRAHEEYNKHNIKNSFMVNVIAALEELKPEPAVKFKVQTDKELHYKDDNLYKLSTSGNVAQFISFSPHELSQRWCVVNGLEPGYKFKTINEAIEVLLENSVDGTVNVRSFKPDEPKGQPFYYGLKSVKKIVQILRKNAAEGRYSIINETIDTHDGGVSGVVCGDIIEFAPNDTPKAVDKPGICSLPRSSGIKLLQSVYGFIPELNYDSTLRVEFSIHPKKRGLKRSHTIIWEIEDIGELPLKARLAWPNNFSQLIGDKAFGLLVADVNSLRVPYSTLISKKLAPFNFGIHTNTGEKWLRTCPSSRVPGKYPTFFGWQDPFKVIHTLEKERTSNDDYVEVVSIIAQEGVDPIYSGSLLPSDKGPYIEGVKGKGDDFMLGIVAPGELPTNLTMLIKELYKELEKKFGPVELEWVYDGHEVWIVQLHQVKEKLILSNRIIYPGKASNYHTFEVEKGLEALRNLIKTLGKSQGVALKGDVGITSHFGDILRRHKIPSHLG